MSASELISGATAIVRMRGSDVIKTQPAAMSHSSLYINPG